MEKSPLKVLLERLKWRSRRSMLEVDLYLDRFIQNGGLNKLTVHELECYANLLEMNDWDFLSLLQKTELSHDKTIDAVIQKIIAK